MSDVELAVVNLCNDHHAGVVQDWPNGYPAGLVEAARCVMSDAGRTQ